MNNNAIIHFTLKSILDKLDARAYVSIFTGIGDDAIKDSVSVYELLADKEFMSTYGSYNVSGLVDFSITSNILITKERI